MTSLIQFSFSLLQLLSSFFLLLCLYKAGNIDASERPFNQMYVQNFAVDLLCTYSYVAAANMTSSTLLGVQTGNL
jgi:hypothetical protein